MTRTIPGWTRVDDRKTGTCGSIWQHTSGWQIGHCGHPTALYPYGMSHPGLPGRLLMSHNGKGFTDIKAARQMVEEIAAGELAFTLDRCGPATARIPTRTASGSEVPPYENYTGDRIQGVWTVDGLQTPKAKLEALAEKCWGYPGAGDDAEALEHAIQALGPDQPPIAGEADKEYNTRIDADRATLQFKDVIRPRKPQDSIEDLPLFGGERQKDLFEE